MPSKARGGQALSKTDSLTRRRRGNRIDVQKSPFTVRPARAHGRLLRAERPRRILRVSFATLARRAYQRPDAWSASCTSRRSQEKGRHGSDPVVRAGDRRHRLRWRVLFLDRRSATQSRSASVDLLPALLVITAITYHVHVIGRFHYP